MHYDWGKKGKSSLVARLLRERTIDPAMPYAELWMGAHANGPSRVKIGDGILLSQVLRTKPELLGEYTRRRWGVLPFLFKVLSIAQPLSIQMHPDKDWAESLNRLDPAHYPDANHKPEIALALSGFKMLYGFKNKTTLLETWQQYPCLAEFLKEVNPTSLDSGRALSIDPQKMLPVLLQLPKEKGLALLKALHNNIMQKKDRSETDSSFLDLYPHYPSDLGLLFLYLMQKVEVAPHSSVFLQANQLHSYLSGDLVECMADSDNVIRAGITNKFKDVERMLSRISYQDQAPPLHAGIPVSDRIRRYPSAAEEFELQTIQLPEGHSILQEETDSPAILLVLSGKGLLSSEGIGFGLESGRVLFTGAQLSYTLCASEALQAVRASVPLPGN